MPYPEFLGAGAMSYPENIVSEHLSQSSGSYVFLNPILSEAIVSLGGVDINVSCWLTSVFRKSLHQQYPLCLEIIPVFQHALVASIFLIRSELSNVVNVMGSIISYIEAVWQICTSTCFPM